MNTSMIRYCYAFGEFKKSPRLRALLMVGAALLSQGASLARAESDQAVPSSNALVDALNGVFGKQTTGRAIHAKGIVLEGVFTPDKAASSLSSAAHFQGGPVPVTVRFSSFAGLPNISDSDGLASPRGLAIKFKLNDGSETDIVSHSFNGFPTATAEEFRHLILAIGASPPGTASPTPAETYMGSHPLAKGFFDGAPVYPVSFATLPYYGVNSFRFTNQSGRSQFVRYQIIPKLGTQVLTSAQVKQASANYLEDELPTRLQGGPVELTLQVQVADATDNEKDPSIAWPASRRTVKLGQLRIERVVADSTSAEQRLLFLPSAVTAGIATADPMIEARSGAYGVSYGRRHQ